MTFFHIKQQKKKKCIRQKLKKKKNQRFRTEFVGLKIRSRERERRRTRKVNPVTEAKEVAIEAAESGRVPRWPTNMTEITWREY